MQSVYQRFISKVNKTNYCWEWIGSKSRGGYGQLRIKEKNKWVMRKAHRFSFEYFKHPLGKYLACHTCDNPSCVNPEHLFAGTAKENTQDMIKKGKWKNPRKKTHVWLSYKIANQIRQMKKKNPHLTCKQLGLEFKTSPQQISRVLRNEIWQEVL